MSAIGPQPQLSRVEEEAYRAVRQRGESLGMLFWLCAPDGRIAWAPRSGGDESGPAWTRSSRVRELVTDAMTADGAEDDATVVEAEKGCWIVGLGRGASGGGAHRAAVMLLGRDFVRSPIVHEIARELGVDESGVREQLRRLATCNRAKAQQMAAVLGWMLEDQLRMARDKASIDGFGIHLAEMYEEIGLLYRLGQSMGQLARPEDFVETACRDVHETIAFLWVAAAFAEADRAAYGVAGSLVVAGEVPAEEAAFEAACARLLPLLGGDRWTLLRPGDSELAGLVKAEVLAHPITRNDRVIGVLLAGNKNPPDVEISSFETQLLDAVAGCIRVFIENADLYTSQRELFLGTIGALAASIDAKDSYTRGHSQRVALLASELALAAGFDEYGAERVRIAGLLHDVGKIGVAEAVLRKVGRLTPDEFEQIKQHPRIGERILADIPFLEDIVPGVLHHHERYDGKGYPDGLAGESIPLIARILTVADSFDAMSSSRSYRPALSRAAVLEEMRQCKGTQFDPALVDLFVRLDLSGYDRLMAAPQQSIGIAA
jgi:HD-GYP domain-containing protein (c-di-GMP phosphodiesterase class II)